MMTDRIRYDADTSMTRVGKAGGKFGDKHRTNRTTFESLA